MLENVALAESMRGLARARGRDYELRRVHRKMVDELLSKGWTVDRELKTGVRLRRGKPAPLLLEDRVWTLLRKMGFPYLSGAGGAKVPIAADKGGATTQIDVVAIDDEVAIAVECKSSERESRKPQFQDDIAKHAGIRKAFAQAANAKQWGARKHHIGLAIFTSNILPSQNDRERAASANVVLFDEHDLAYYERLVSHLGPAAKYQFLSDLLPGKVIAGLQLRVPAIRTKMGGTYAYTFLASPEYLLKIAHVSHRSKGRASDVHTYQRMLSKSRLARIGEYITDDGIFPTNVVLNIDTGNTKVVFERISQQVDADSDPDRGLLGWLDIRPAYKSAWVIDGQHRLFAYSGHKRAAKGLLSVLAFEGLAPSTQAQLFIDINSKQKSVKQSLLQELYAELHWDSDAPRVRVRAIVSKAVQVLGADRSSPFFERVQTANVEKSTNRCITLNSIYSALESSGLYVVREKQGQVMEYGPLWAVENDATLRRTTAVLNAWFGEIRECALDWWELGRDEGGGLAMNDSVISLIRVMQSVVDHLDTGPRRLRDLSDEELIACLHPYAHALGQHLAGLSAEERKQFRDPRGVQGQTTRTRRCQGALQTAFPAFNPAGLEEFIEGEKTQTNAKAKQTVDRIEVMLQKLVLGKLREVYSADETQWWTTGVPLSIRLEAVKRYEQSNHERSGPEMWLNLIDYREIALANWTAFEPILGHGKKNQSKQSRTSWMSHLNDRRRVVSHASSGVTLSVIELEELEGYERWLVSQIARAAGGADADPGGPDEGDPSD
jgi:DNA sulfur modification protein DndB